MADAFDALFYGNIEVGVGRKEDDYYFVDPTRLPAEVFADLSSILSIDGDEEPMLKALFSVIKSLY